MALDTPSAPTHHEPNKPDGDHGSFWEKHNRLLRPAAAVTAALAALGIVAATTRGGDEKASNPTPTASGEQIPGSTAVEPSPSASEVSPSDLPSVAPTEQLSDLEAQKKLYSEVTIPNEVLSYDFLNSYADKSAYNEKVYGDTALQEAYSDFGQLTPEDIAANLAIGDEIFAGKYTDIVDGKPVSQSAGEYFKNGVGLPMDRGILDGVLSDAKANGLSESSALAQYILSAALDSTTDAVDTARRAQERVAEYNAIEENKEHLATPSTVSPTRVGEFGFIGNGKIPTDPTQIEHGSAQIIDVSETNLKSADEQVTATYIGAYIQFKEIGNPNPQIVTIVFEQPKQILVAGAEGRANLVDGEGTVYARLLGPVRQLELAK